MSTSMLKHLQMFLCLLKVECMNTNYRCSNTFVRLVYIHKNFYLQAFSVKLIHDRFQLDNLQYSYKQFRV